MSMWPGLEAGVVVGLRRRERMSLQGRAERRKGLKVVRKVEIVDRGMVILAVVLLESWNVFFL